jgi:hypothetical protein
MKNIYKMAFLFTAALMVSCADELDINTDPNVPEEITTGLALSSAEASLMTVVGGDFTNLGGFYAQYHTQAPSAAQYEIIDQYNINTAYANRPWAELYAGCLNDLKYVKTKAAEEDDAGTVLIATVLEAYTFQLLVDVFGDVPYTEALQGANNITPHVTPGNEIYADLLAKIDVALADYNENPNLPTIGSNDIIFIKKGYDDPNHGSDEEVVTAAMENWVRFANSLKLKLYLRMAYTPQANPGAVAALLAENNFLTEDVSFANFGTSLGQRNPFFEIQITFLGDVNNIASNSLLEFYNSNSDPRTQGVFRANATATYTGLPQGGGLALDTQPSAYSRPKIIDQTPVYFMSVAESYFLQAEGLIRYAGGAGAQAKYDAGVQASFDLYNVGSAAAFTGTGGVYEYVTGTDVEATVRQVIIQKWAALPYVNNIEAYIETTRTKFPEVVAEDDVNYAIGNRIPSRVSVLQGLTVPSILYYPTDELNRNPNISQHTSLTQKVWWDQKN